MLKKIKKEIAHFLRENPLLVAYSFIGNVIFSFILYSEADDQLKHALAYAFMLALPLCVGVGYLVADQVIRKAWAAPIVFAIFASGFGVVYSLEAQTAFQMHLLAIAILLFLLFPQAVRRDERLGFHWMIEVLFAIGSSLAISGILLGLVSFLVWVVGELFYIKPPKLLSDVGLGFFTVVLPINIFAFLKPRPNAVALLKYELTGATEKIIKVLFTPVLLTYLIVLLSYTAKILIDLKLPQGMVSVPISIAYGMFFVLDAYIESQGREIEGIWKYRKWIRVVFAPLFVVMGVGIGVRIAEYGFTEQRVYLLIGFFYMLTSVFVRIRWSALELRKLIALGVSILLLTSAGPLTPKSLMLQSQSDRFIKIIEKYGSGYHGIEDFKLSTWNLFDISSARSSLQSVILAKGEVALFNKGVERGVFVEVASGEGISDFLKELETQLSRLDSTNRHGKNKGADQRVCQSFEVPWVKRSPVLRVSGYDWRIEIDLNKEDKTYPLKIPDLSDHFKIEMAAQSLIFVRGDVTEEVIGFGDEVRRYVENSKAGKADLPLELEGKVRGYRLLMIIWRASLDCEDERMSGEILVGVGR